MCAVVGRVYGCALFGVGINGVCSLTHPLSSKNTYNERFASAVADENRAPLLQPNFERKLALATPCFPEVVSKVRHIAALPRNKKERWIGQRYPRNSVMREKAGRDIAALFALNAPTLCRHSRAVCLLWLNPFFWDLGVWGGGRGRQSPLSPPPLHL